MSYKSNIMNNERKPIKTYKTTISITLVVALHIAGIVMFVYVLAVADTLWWHWVLIGLALATVVCWTVGWLLHLKDKIVIFENSLLLTHADRKCRNGKWKSVRNVELPWYTIKGFASTTESLYEFTYHPFAFRRWIEISVPDGVTYRVSPDLYYTFRLKKKLQRYFEKYHK